MTQRSVAPIMPLAGQPTRADFALAKLAAAVIHAAKRGDYHAISVAIDKTERWQLAKFIGILATAASADEVLYSCGLTDDSVLCQMRREYERLKGEGLTAAQMPPEVVEGRRAYDRVAFRRRQRNGKGKAA